MVEELDPRLKPLYANLMRLGFDQYLDSSEFNHLLIERNLDREWKACLNVVRGESNVVVLIPGYTGNERKAFAMFLEILFRKGNQNQLPAFFNEILTDFVEWKDGSIDLTKVKSSLNKLGIKGIDIKSIESDPNFTRSKNKSKKEQKLKFSQTKVSIDHKLCFVLMPFSKKFDSIYSDVIKRIVEEDNNLRCKRADEIFGTRPIMEDIWKYIKAARFLIADLTDRNPNVFYELGIAHCLEKEVILISQDLNDIPFDLRHIRCLQYEDSIAGANLLKDGIDNTVKAILK